MNARADAFYDLAACRGFPTEWWFPHQGVNAREAIAICHACPVATECLAYAVEGVAGGRVLQGIWSATNYKAASKVEGSDGHTEDGVMALIDKTYRRADGEPIYDQFGWVTDLDFFDDEEEPVELVEERWTCVGSRTFWVMPPSLYSCTKDLDCDEDAVKWEQQADGGWEQTCALHAETVTQRTP